MNEIIAGIEVPCTAAAAETTRLVEAGLSPLLFHHSRRVFLLGAPYTLMRDEHVRIDVIAGRFSERTQVWIDIFGILLFLLPISLIILWLSIPYFWLSYAGHEMSGNAGGLIRWPAKFLIVAGFFLLILQGLSELIKRFAAPIPAIVIAEMIGLPAEMAPQLLDWSNRMVRMYMFGVTREVELDADRASRDFMDYLRGVIAERRKAPREDLLSHMLTSEIDGQRLDEEEVISTAILLLNAGHEATVHTTGNAVKTILESGLDPQTLFASEEQTAATVEECLRFDAPLHMFTRYALADVEYEGLRFKKGEVIGLMLGAANRDPERFANADRFDPFRTDGANVSFGAGIHFCIGAPLARIELQVALATLFRRLPTLKLAAEPRYNNVYHFHGLERLDVAW